MAVVPGSSSLKNLLYDSIASGPKDLGSKMITLRRAADFWILIHSLLECGKYDRSYFLAAKSVGTDFVRLNDWVWSYGESECGSVHPS